MKYVATIQIECEEKKQAFDLRKLSMFNSSEFCLISYPKCLLYFFYITLFFELNDDEELER